MNLNVLICTFEEGLFNLKDRIPSQMVNVHYFISHQLGRFCSFDVPDFIRNRTDISYSTLSGIGLSNNRNNVIRMLQFSKKDGIFLIADDDIVFAENFYYTITSGYDVFSQFDLICYQIENLDSNFPFKKYPKTHRKVNIFSINKISSIEITGKVEVLNHISFDSNLGIGTYFSSGEETAFLADALKLDYKILFVPKTIVKHPYLSTGKMFSNIYTSESLNKIGGRAYRIYGNNLALLFYFFSATKNYFKYCDSISFFEYLKYLIEGKRVYKNLQND
jgi:hypothetical protein